MDCKPCVARDMHSASWLENKRGLGSITRWRFYPQEVWEARQDQCKRLSTLRQERDSVPIPFFCVLKKQLLICRSSVEESKCDLKVLRGQSWCMRLLTKAKRKKNSRKLAWSMCFTEQDYLRGMNVKTLSLIWHCALYMYRASAIWGKKSLLLH